MANVGETWQSWSPRRRRAIAIASGAGVLVLISAGAGIAASLGVPGTDLGISSVDANCQSVTTNPITPSFNYEYEPSTPGFVISAVTLSGLQASCLNKDVTIVLADAAGTSIATATGTTPASGTTATIPLTTQYSMASAFPIQLTIAVTS